MKSIIVAFTLKEQDFQKIQQVLDGISHNNQENMLCIHGFMPRKEVLQKGWSTAVCDTLDSMFPVQLNMYHNGPLRKEMVEIAAKLGAIVYVIGAVKEGVFQEVELYKSAALEIIYLPIPE